MEGLSSICAGLVSIEEDDEGNKIGYSKDEYCLDNLKDLLRFLRRDDPEKRDVFKQVCKWNIVSKDLIPIIEQFQDDRNLVLNSVKVLVFLTMPVEPTSHDIPQQIEYLWGLKASITSSNAVPIIVSLLEGPLENLEREVFTEEDWKLVQLVFTLFRNLLAILDIPPHQKAGGSTAQFLNLRDKLLEQLFHENVMDLILVLVQHVDGSCKYLRHDNLLLLEILHYIFMGQEPGLIAKAYSNDLKVDGGAKTTDSLRIMMEEDKKKLARVRHMSCYAQLSGIFTRETMGGSKTLLKGNPSTSSAESLLKSHQVHRGPLKKAARDHGSLPSTDGKILRLLHDFINQLLSGGYNVLMQSIRQDIEKEYHTIQDSDIVIFFQVAQFVTSFQHHQLSSKEKVEADSFEASTSSQADSTLFRGSMCGPIAATMNEPMFQLVVSKWRYAYEGLKETKDYNYVSAAGSLMKTMIRMLDLVLKVFPEDSMEPQTARVLLYKLFYDQTDEGMTQFLLNQIKSFDNHKQAKSDLVDLVETIYVVIRLMENLQARGTLRVSRKSRRKRAKRKSDDKKDNIEQPVKDNVQTENTVGSLGCEPPSDTTVISENFVNTNSDEKDKDTEIPSAVHEPVTFESETPNQESNPMETTKKPPDSAVISEKFVNTNSDGKDEDTEIPCAVHEPITFESETPNEESHPTETTKKPRNENKDEMDDEFGDSSDDEQLAATNEVDFKVSSLVSALASNAIIKNLCWLLKFYKSNSLRTNHYIICLLRKICDDLELSPMLYQLSYLSTFYMIMNEQKSSPSKEYENLNEFLTTLVRRMMRKMKSQPLLFIEILFLKTRKECHYINCESLVHEVGKLKGENKYQNFSKDGEIGSTQGEGWVRRSLGDALGDDEADFVHSREKEDPSNVGSDTESFGVEGENAASIANNGSHSKRNNESDRNLEPGSEGLPKRRKRLVLDENMESKIKDLYEIHKNDRQCSRLIAEALDSGENVSPVQVSNKLRQLGLKVRPKKRMLQDETPDYPTEEGASNLSPDSGLKESSASKPLHTRKRVRAAFTEAQEMTIRDLFEHFKDDKKCSHMIANALDAGGKFTATQVSRKLKQLGLLIPKRKRSGANTQLMDEAEDSENETLLTLRKRSKSKNSVRDIQVVKNTGEEDNTDDETLISAFGSKSKNTERDNHVNNTREESSEDHSDDETLISAFGSKSKNTERDDHVVNNTGEDSSEDHSDDETLLSAFGKTRRESNSGCEQRDTSNVAERYDDRSPVTEAKDLEDFTPNETSYISSEKQLQAIIANDENELPHQHLEDELADRLSDSEDEATPVASQNDAVSRRKARLVMDFDDDDD